MDFLMDHKQVTIENLRFFKTNGNLNHPVFFSYFNSSYKHMGDWPLTISQSCYKTLSIEFVNFQQLSNSSLICCLRERLRCKSHIFHSFVMALHTQLLTQRIQYRTLLLYKQYVFVSFTLPGLNLTILKLVLKVVISLYNCYLLLIHCDTHQVYKWNKRVEGLKKEKCGFWGLLWAQPLS